MDSRSFMLYLRKGSLPVSVGSKIRKVGWQFLAKKPLLQFPVLPSLHQEAVTKEYWVEKEIDPYTIRPPTEKISVAQREDRAPVLLGSVEKTVLWVIYSSLTFLSLSDMGIPVKTILKVWWHLDKNGCYLFLIPPYDLSFFLLQVLNMSQCWITLPSYMMALAWLPLRMYHWPR